MRPLLATEWTDGTDEPALLVSDIQTSALDSLKGATLTESELDSLVIAKEKAAPG